MPKPVCAKCQCFYRPEKNGYAFIEGMPTQDGARRGKVDAHLWKPYKLWVGDLWKCPECEHLLVVGALGQIFEHYLPDFKATCEKLGANQLQVNDC